MARSPRRRIAQAPAAGAATALRENLPRPSAPVATPRGEPGKPAQQLRRRSPFGFLRKLEPRFIADIVSELRKVTWPTFAETRYLTMVVAIVAIAVGIFLGGIDLLFGWVIERLFF